MIWRCCVQTTRSTVVFSPNAKTKQFFFSRRSICSLFVLSMNPLYATPTGQSRHQGGLHSSSRHVQAVKQSICSTLVFKHPAGSSRSVAPPTMLVPAQQDVTSSEGGDHGSFPAREGATRSFRGRIVDERIAHEGGEREGGRRAEEVEEGPDDRPDDRDEHDAGDEVEDTGHCTDGEETGDEVQGAGLVQSSLYALMGALWRPPTPANAGAGGVAPQHHHPLSIGVTGPIAAEVGMRVVLTQEYTLREDFDRFHLSCCLQYAHAVRLRYKSMYDRLGCFGRSSRGCCMPLAAAAEFHS